MIDDVFCKIIKKELSAEIVMEGKDWLAFKDIHPSAPVHILIVPKKHIGGIEEATEEDAELIGELFLAAKKVAKKMELDKGYRVIINQGEHGGQMVPHLHIHLLGGKRLGTKIVSDPKE
jgi:histidine triad (HIT) family protein